eukprot:scaffold34989_cov118-Isochrysis_galbana.AAC.9
MCISSAAAAARMAGATYGGGAPNCGRSALPPATMASTAAGGTRVSADGSPARHRRRSTPSAPADGCRMAGDRNWALPFVSAPPNSAGARQGRWPPEPPVGSGRGKPKARSKKTRSGSRPALASLTSSSFLRDPATLDWSELIANGTANQKAGCSANPSLAEKRSARSTRRGSSRSTLIHQMACSSQSREPHAAGRAPAGETGMASGGEKPTIRSFLANSTSSSERSTLARTTSTSAPMG